MRRLSLVLAVLLVSLLAANAFAIDTQRRAVRIGILAPADSRTAELVRGAIRNALRHRGFDAFDARDTGDAADYFVDLLASRGDARPVAGVAVPIAASVGVEWEILVDRIAADVRLYDGRTMDEIRTFDLRRRTASVAPSAVFVSRNIWAAVALPVFEWTAHRGVVRELGEEAAARIADELR